MARPAKSSAPTPVADLDAFDQQVALALEHINDLEYLGRNSPLAQPYFLGHTLAIDAAGDVPSARGETLRRLLRTCANQLDVEEQRLLEITYFGRQTSLDNIGLADRMNVAERTFYRMRLRAIKSLAQILNQAAVPVLRPEAPAPHTLVGRAGLYEPLIVALANKRSVYLTGPTGVGKSAFAVTILQRWQSSGQPGGWYTLRSQVNDHAISLVFALAHKLRTLGAGQTWRQLVVERGVANWERTFGLLRYDLTAFDASSLLLCIDDMDVLQDDVAEHVQILHVLETVKLHCPLLLIGQRMLLPADDHVVLPGLDTEAAAALLVEQNAAPPSLTFLSELVSHTRGHPSLLLLYAALVRAGEDPVSGLDLLARSPTLEALFHRIWRRLKTEERALLLQLAVFRTPAPQDAWSDQLDLLARLQARGLVVVGSDGGVQVDPHLQRSVDAQISADERPLLHLRAAAICEAHGEFVAAMHHAVAGRQPARAVWLWFIHRHLEIERGRGAAALEVLRAIALADLPNAQDRNALLLARSELYKLAGAVDAAAGELDGMPTGGRNALAAYMRFVKGQIQEMQGQAEQALESYRAAIDIYTGLPQPYVAKAHLQKSFVHLYRLHDLHQARREAMLARARADAFLGDLETMAGHYQAALDYLHSAQAIAEQIDDDLSVCSRIYSYLGALYGRLGKLEQALAYIDLAQDCDHRRGDAVGPLYDQLNRVAALYVAERYVESYDEGCKGLAAAERLRNTYLVAGLAAGIAEACCALNRWDEAEHYVMLSLQQEEEFFRAPACVSLALVRQTQGRTQDALSLLHQALENSQQIGDVYMEASVWSATARIQEATGMLAEGAWRHALTLYRELGIEYEVERIGSRLSVL